MIRLTTNFGVIDLELDYEHAPATSKNFEQYVRDGFYNNTIFHRVIPGFMIQGGGFEPGMKQKQTREPIENEAANGLRNDKYTIAMARTSDPPWPARATRTRPRPNFSSTLLTTTF